MFSCTFFSFFCECNRSPNFNERLRGHIAYLNEKSLIKYALQYQKQNILTIRYSGYCTKSYKIRQFLSTFCCCKYQALFWSYLPLCVPTFPQGIMEFLICPTCAFKTVCFFDRIPLQRVFLFIFLCKTLTSFPSIDVTLYFGDHDLSKPESSLPEAVL